MAYIRRVRNTANQPFDLHDSRLGDGAEFNIVKDWAVNNTESTKYITNRTHYTDNEFELIYPDWNGYFSNQFAPEIIELNNGMVLYKLTNSSITTTIADSDLEDIIVFYKPSSGTVQNTKTISEIFTEETAEIQSTSQIGSNVEEVVYGTDTNTFTIYNVVAKESVEIGNKTVTLETGIYAIGNPNALEADIHPIKKPDQIIKLDIKYIPDSLIQDVNGLKTNYTTKTYVDGQIQSVINQIPDISVKMDKVNPEGSGHFKLLKTAGNIPSNIYVTGDVYSNYDPTDVTAQKKLATEAQLATKMDASKRIFDSLFIGTDQNNNRVLTEADIPTISGKIFKGLYAKPEFLPVGASYVDEGDYAYVLDDYNAGSNATVTKYIYTNSYWEKEILRKTYFIIEDGVWISKSLDQIDQTIYTLTDSIDHNPITAGTPIAGYDTTTIYIFNTYTVINNTFTPAQWKNINTSFATEIASYNSRIIQLEDKVAELEAKIDVMFEFAEGQEF